MEVRGQRVRGLDDKDSIVSCGKMNDKGFPANASLSLSTSFGGVKGLDSEVIRAFIDSFILDSPIHFRAPWCATLGVRGWQRLNGERRLGQNTSTGYLPS